MLFNSLQFLVFFLVFLPIYFGTPASRRWIPILAGSYVFYMAWNVSLAFLLMGLTIAAYWAGRALEAPLSRGPRRAILTVAILAILAPLAIFKYLNFTISIVNDLGALLHASPSIPFADLIVPVGISFHTYQMISYLVDVSGGHCPAERHLGRFASFVVFFPQLVAGPIERAEHMLPQFHRATRLEYDRVRDGILQATWGLSKKVCVADLVAPFVASVYAEPRMYNGSYLALATVLFAVQIYCDFSGYSDMALGIARILGYDLMTNFRQPYFSTSLGEFWRRWHISLSSWFRDYVYFPLGGNRVGLPRRAVNILLVFTLSGIWHGAAWTFIVWGALHGLGLLIEQVARGTIGRRPPSAEPGPARSRIKALLGWLITTVVVLVGWVFFRAQSLDDALYITSHLLDFGPLHYGTFKLLKLPSFELLLAALQILLIFAVDFVLRFQPAGPLRWWQARPVRWTLFLLLVYNVIFFGVFEKVDFIYFAF